ncbi:kinase-like protein [Tothia fuscella]|uniref:non-specific serine/threonine protein kinase n=1 Tax=Tothia fuscella TaxID=1048955 RepID=A0A9P4NG07_9PEZI|nr:kinase-like protein [Tothia fuscella]
MVQDKITTNDDLPHTAFPKKALLEPVVKADGKGGFIKQAWYCRSYIGGGGFGKCYHWILYDTDTNKVVKSVVSKNMDLSASDWNDRRTWSSPYTPGGVLSEVYIHQRLSQTGNTSILPYLGYKLDKKKYQAKIYTSYSNRGELFGLMKHYNRMSHRAGTPCPIPEPYIWHVANSLLNSMNCMYSGATNKNIAGPGEWVEVVHLDFKAHNLLLFDPDPKDRIASKYHWPSVKVIDFGLARELRDDFANPRDYKGPGTTDFRAPEQRGRDNATNSLPFSCATDVWGLGTNY